MSDVEQPITSNFNPFKLRKAELARLLDVSDESIANYTKSGMPVSGKGHSARYVLGPCIQWVIQLEAGKLAKQKRPISDDMQALELREQAAITLEREYKTAAIAKEVVNREWAENEMSKILEPIRAKVLSIPGSWGHKLVGKKSLPDVTELLRDLTHDLLDEAAHEIDNPYTEANEDETEFDLPEEQSDGVVEGISDNSSDIE